MRFSIEFGLGLDGQVAAATAEANEAAVGVTDEAEPPLGQSQGHLLGEVRVRSNVTRGLYDWDLVVPGEIVQNHHPTADQFLTPLQRAEKMYYVPCSECGRTIYEIERDGCDPCAAKGRAVSTAEARARREARRTTAV
jgi:hypothetical protein